MARTRRLPKYRRSANSESIFLWLFRKYKDSARVKQHEFFLTVEEFRHLIKQNCYVCGAPPFNRFQVKTRCVGYIIYNGIDRVDNSKGYVISNCKPCCKHCNRMKSNRSLKELTNHAKKIVAYQQPSKSGPIKTTVKS